MKNSEKKAIILCMEILARNINNEDIFESWLLCGIPDGDIPYENAVDSIAKIADEFIDDYDLLLTEPNWYCDLTQLFLKLMRKASADGGLCTY